MPPMSSLLAAAARRVTPSARCLPAPAVLGLALVVMGWHMPVAFAATITVTTTADGGAGSLREAIATSNASTGVLDTIAFAIPPLDGTVKTITLATALPDITDPVVIDGYTQDDAHPNTLATGDDAVLRVELTGGGLTVANGLVIDSGGSTVRGLVINGFPTAGSNGIRMVSAGGNLIEGNFIGTDPTGTLAVPIGDDAMAIESNSNANTIGGTTPAARNVISGNENVALFVATAGNVIQGNYIGVQRDGTSPLGNLQGVGFVGVGAASGNLVGGTLPGAGNVIAFNTFRGILVEAGAGTGNAFLGNSIYSNGALGIDLIPVGVTPNDALDADGGANDLQNFPALDSPIFAGGASATGTLDSTPGRSYRIEVFANDECDPSGNGEGKTFVGTVDTATTDGAGHVAFAVAFGQTLGATLLTATATDLTTNDSSEFSACPLPPTTTSTSVTTTTVTSTSTTSTTSTSTTSSTSSSFTTSTLAVTTTTTTTLPTHVDGFILPRRVAVHADAAVPARSTLATSGTFDTGSQPADLTAAATLHVGGLTVTVPALTSVAGGRQFRFSQDGLVFTVIPARTRSSKAHFKMTLRQDLTGLVDPEGPLTVRFTDPAVDGSGVVTLGHGHFVLGRKPGTLLAPRLYVFRVRAHLSGAGGDELTVLVGFATDGHPPAVAPDVGLTFGDTYALTVPGSSFVRKGGQFVAKNRATRTTAVLDFLRETLAVHVSGVDLGTFVDGPQQVRVGVTLGPEVSTDDVRMVRAGSALRY